MIDYGLRGRRALVTGASHGIGLEIVKSLAGQGVSVAILSRNQSALDRLSTELVAMNVDSIPLVCDVLSEDSVSMAWNLVQEKWDGVDILINNVGGGGRWGSTNVFETPTNVWQEVYRKNAGVATQLTLLALPSMLKRKWGRVVAITSIFGDAIGGRPWFNVAKVAQTTLMKNFSQKREFARSGITFNAVAPGSILIPDTGWDEMRLKSPIEYSEYLESLPLGRLGEPEEVASVVVYLCSSQAKYVNGSSIVVDGGESLTKLQLQ